MTLLNFREINPAAGLDLAEVSYGIRGSGLSFVLLSDVSGTSRIAASAGDGRPTQYHGRHTAPDGRKVEWAYEPADSKTGGMTINGTRYELGRGSFFLVASRGGPMRVLQLNRDLSAVRPEKESLEGFLRDDADLGLFFAKGAVDK